MRAKRLFQTFVVFALLFSSFGGSKPAFAGTDAAPQQEPIVINRNLNIWDATFIGFVSASIHEKWSLELTEPHTFEVKASTVAGDLVPLLILLDSNSVELARGIGSLTTSQPAGSYFIQVQPESGGGFYFLTLRDVAVNLPSASTVVNPTSLNVGETATVTVSLNNVPAEGYTSAEFTCTYNATLVDVSNIVVTNLFGADPAAAISTPQNGSFIVAIAGSNGNKAATSGAAFSFSVTAVQAGQTSIECVARVSQGNNVLTTLPSTPASLTVNGSNPTSTPTAGGPSETPTSPPAGSPTATNTSAPGETSTATATQTSGPVESPTPTATFTPVESPTPSFTPLPTFTSTPVASPTPLPNGTLTGQVIASKPVTVSLFSGNTLVTSVTANPDGTFNLTAPAGSYTVVATAGGFLSAQGSAVLNPGSTTTKPNVTLLAGDIDNNNVIDQFDALTIGINYNSASPAAADLNNDGIINVLDLELLAQNYRETGPIVWE